MKPYHILWFLSSTSRMALELNSLGLVDSLSSIKICPHGKIHKIYVQGRDIMSLRHPVRPP